MVQPTAAASPTPPTSPTSPANVSSIRMLFVDDSADICGAISIAARSEPGIECSTALTTNGIDAAMDAWKPTIVVMDLSIPGESPLDVIRALSKSHPAARIIAFSGYDDDVTAGRVYDAGGWGLISKSREISELFDVVRKIAGANAAA